jgi:hypothetical protein
VITQEQAQRAAGLAHERLQKLAGYNGPYGARASAEALYAQAYDQLAGLGLRRRLRAKYRQ